MKNVFKTTQIYLPAYFQNLPYYDLAYKRRLSELVNRTYEVGYSEVKLLYPQQQIQWQLNKCIKLICNLKEDLKSQIIGWIAYYKPRYRVPNFRYILKLELTDVTLQLQFYIIYDDYTAKTITSIRHEINRLFSESFKDHNSEMFFDTALKTDFRELFVKLKSQYGLLKFFLVTKCKIV